MASTLDENMKAALELLPPAGQEVEFDEFKAKLYAANPNTGRDVFAHLLRRDLVGKRMNTLGDHQHVVMLSRKAAPVAPSKK